MSEKVFNLVSGILHGAEVIGSACVIYFVDDKTQATAIVAGIGLAVNSAIKVMQQFVKKELTK